jgi:hypothetical protein
MKNLWWRIVGEALAVLWGIVCWLEARPIRYCEACDEWHRPDENHPAPRDPDETRRALLCWMHFDPDFGPEMLRCLRGVPEFAEFVAQNIGLPDPPRSEDPLAIFRPKPLPGGLAARVSETLVRKNSSG